MTVYDELLRLKDDKYKEFQAKLVPNIAPDTIIGVRTPALRKLAKEMLNSEEKGIFLKSLPHKYYEENLIHFFIISMIRDFDECIREVETFLPYVDCWPVSDQATPVSFKKNHEKLLPYIKKWIKSKHLYTSRFGIRMLMNEFLGDEFKDEYPKLVASVKSDEYYLKMMVAWYFATALAKNYDETIAYIEERRLDDWVLKKTVQKAVESYRVTDEHKNYLQAIKGTVL